MTGGAWRKDSRNEAGDVCVSSTIGKFFTFFLYTLLNDFLLDLGVQTNEWPRRYVGSIMLRGEHLKRLCVKFKYLRGTVRYLFSLIEAHIFTLRIYLAERYPYRDCQSFLAGMTTTCNFCECTRIIYPLVRCVCRCRLHNDSNNFCFLQFFSFIFLEGQMQG